MRDQSGEPYPRVRRAPASKLQVAATQPLSPPRGYAAHALVVRKERLADGVRAKFAVCSSRARRPASSLARCAWAARVAALAPKPKVLLSRARHGTREGSRATLAKRRTEAAQPLQGRSRFRDLSQWPWRNVSPVFESFPTHTNESTNLLGTQENVPILEGCCVVALLAHAARNTVCDATRLAHAAQYRACDAAHLAHAAQDPEPANCPFALCCMPPLPWAFARAACPL